MANNGALQIDVDVLLYGAGFVQCAIAAILSSRGKRCFIVDDCKYYGRSFASIPLSDMLSLQNLNVRRSTVANQSMRDEIMTIKNNKHPLAGIFKECEVVKYAQHDFVNHIKFVELSSFPIFLNESLIDTIKDLGITDYVEFVPVDGVYLKERDAYFRLPLSKEEIFMHPRLNLAEKRQWMKLLTKLKSSTLAESSRSNFVEWLSAETGNSINELAKSTIIHVLAGLTISAASDADYTKQGIGRLSLFTSSVGKFGSPSPLVLPLHGCSELVQGFARKACIFGSSVCLDADIEEISFPNGLEKGYQVLLKDGTRITSATFIADKSLSAVSLKVVGVEYRAVVISRIPFVENSDENISHMVIPEANLRPLCHVVQCRQKGCHEPAAYYTLYLFTTSAGIEDLPLLSPKEALEPILLYLCRNDTSNLVLAMYGSNLLHDIGSREHLQDGSTCFFVQDVSFMPPYHHHEDGTVYEGIVSQVRQTVNCIK